MQFSSDPEFLKSSIVRQFMYPQGAVGALAGHLMARKNQERIRWAVRELNLQPGQRVLEIGHGPGVAIEEIGSRSPSCEVIGVDPSTVMHAQASRRNRKGIDKRKICLRAVAAEQYDGRDGPFDLAFAINALSFCTDPPGVVAKTVGWLNPGGRVVIVHQIPMESVQKSLIDQRQKEFSGWLQKGGLQITRVLDLPAKPNPVVFVEGALPIL